MGSFGGPVFGGGEWHLLLAIFMLSAKNKQILAHVNLQVLIFVAVFLYRSAKEASAQNKNMHCWKGLVGMHHLVASFNEAWPKGKQQQSLLLR